MKFIVDTNVISELRKGPRCDPNVARWYTSVSDGDLYLSVLVLGEVWKGIDLARARDPNKARALEAWLTEVERAFGDRILPVDRNVVKEWGRMAALRSVPVIDALLAATARARHMTLATRNIADVAGLGASVIDPFARIV